MTVRVGFLGAGLIATFHSKMLHGSGADVAWAGVYDPDPDRASAFANASGATACSSEEQVLDDCDAVYVCTWTSEHRRLVEGAVTRGLPVFCEKPLSTDLAGATAMADLVREAGVVNQVGLILRRSPAFLLVRDLVADPASGRVMSVVFRDDQFIPVQGSYASTWRGDRTKAGSGTLLEHSIHDLDILEFTSGRVDAVSARSANFHGLDGIEDSVATTVQFEAGGVGTMVSIWHDILERPSLRRVEIFCERAWIVMEEDDWFGPVSWTRLGGEAQKLTGGDLVAECQRRGLRMANPDEDFIASVVSGQPATPSFADALRAHVLADAVYRSAATEGRCGRHHRNVVRAFVGAPVRSAAVPAEAFRAPKGTQDVLAPESTRWEALLGVFAGTVEAAGYGLVVSPMFEDIGVFRRIGEGTDVVTKEMYDFFDKGDPPRHIALRPEGTASVVRAFVQHHPVTPWKAWYATPAFRYEAPQAGRFRQHHQVGVEALGSDDPDLDVEVITLGADYLRSLGLQRNVLLLNSMGSREDRARYVDVLRTWLTERIGDLDEDDRAKVDTNPMRVLDSKRRATHAAVADAPRITDHLSDEAGAHFERVQRGLSSLGIDVVLEPRLVRGLDYYTHTTFEFQSSALDAAQSGILGGGRYDGLAEDLGGPPTPGIGFGSGIERVLLACDAEGVFAAPTAGVDVFVVDVTGGEIARDLTTELRRAGIRVDRAFDARSMRAQMKAADRSGASVALIIGEQEAADGVVAVRSLQAEERNQELVPRADLLAHLEGALRTES